MITAEAYFTKAYSRKGKPGHIPMIIKYANYRCHGKCGRWYSGLDGFVLQSKGKVSFLCKTDAKEAS